MFGWSGLTVSVVTRWKLDADKERLSGCPIVVELKIYGNRRHCGVRLLARLGYILGNEGE